MAELREKTRGYFNGFLHKSLNIFMILITIFSIGVIICAWGAGLYKSPIIMVPITIIFLLFRKKIRKAAILEFISKINIFHIIGIAFIIRLLFIVFIKTEPTSDFKYMYEYAANVANGEYFGFHDYSYFARFAHDTVTVLYFSLFYHVSNEPLFLIKFANIIFQTISVVYIYKLSKEIFQSENIAKTSGLMLALFPPAILFTSIPMSENMAIPFYMASVYYLFKGLKSNKKNSVLWFLLCGALLGVANMFRMVGLVFVIAFAMYIVIYKGWKIFLVAMIPICISFGIVMGVSSVNLVNSGITEVQLWNSKEPSITSILKGTNISSLGMFNSEDASVPEKFNYDSELIKEESKRLIKERLTTTNPVKLCGFYIVKVAVQWGFGEYSASEFTGNSENGIIVQNKFVVLFLAAIYYTIILLQVRKNMKEDKKASRNELKFFYILLGGFILMYMISEMQPRYAYTAAWIFVLLAGPNLEKLNFKMSIQKWKLPFKKAKA